MLTEQVAFEFEAVRCMKTGEMWAEVVQKYYNVVTVYGRLLGLAELPGVG